MKTGAWKILSTQQCQFSSLTYFKHQFSQSLVCMMIVNHNRWGFPGGTVLKNPPANSGDARDVGLILGGEDSLEQEMATHFSILAWKIHGQRSLEGYGSWGHKKSDMTQRLNTKHVFERKSRDFTGGPVAKTPCSQSRGPRFVPWLGNQILHAATKTRQNQIND